MNDIDTAITEPPVEEDGDGYKSARVAMYFSDTDERSYDAGMQLFDTDSTDPAAFADSVLRVSLAVANLRGSDYSWALIQRLAAYDGS